jgi:hypothetical protein
VAARLSSLVFGRLNFTRYYKSPAFLEAKETLVDNHMIQKIDLKKPGGGHQAPGEL